VPASTATRPGSAEEVVETLRDAGAHRHRVRARGGATKLGWGRPVEDPEVDLDLSGLDRVLEHNEGDLTAVLEPGVPLARAQERFAAAGQMLALDPPLGPDEAATVGGVFAAGDSGPLRHRYGGPRDLIIGIGVALSDGTSARSGGKVIKNVAGYDLAKLFTGSFGTLGVITEVVVRLHPLDPDTATARGRTDDARRLADAASALTHARTETVSLDVAWSDGAGHVLARFGGRSAADQARAGVELLAEAGLEADLLGDDSALWEAQREGQRPAVGDGAVVRVSSVQTELPRVLGATAAHGGSLVGRAALGLSWIALPGTWGPEALAAELERLRAALAPAPCVIQQAPAEVRSRLDPWGVGDGAALELMRRTKARFDPSGVCNPGVFVGGI
jgi:glycolate oxidase FAD binding subunit